MNVNAIIIILDVVALHFMVAIIQFNIFTNPIKLNQLYLASFVNAWRWYQHRYVKGDSDQCKICVFCIINSHNKTIDIHYMYEHIYSTARWFSKYVNKGNTVYWYSVAEVKYVVDQTNKVNYFWLTCKIRRHKSDIKATPSRKIWHEFDPGS